MEDMAMYKKFAILSFLLILVSISCQRVDIEAEEQAIKAVLKKQTDSFYNKSLEGEADVWAQEPYVFRGLSVAEPVIGWEALSKLYREVFQSAAWPPYLSEHSRHFIHIRDDVAWTVYHQVVYVENEKGLKETVEGWEHRILEKKDGQWKIVLQLSGPYPQEPEDTYVQEALEADTQLEESQ